MRRLVWFLFALFLVVVLGLLDQLESHFLSLLIFYLIPISIAAWLVSQWAGLFMLVMSIGFWVADDVVSSHSYLRPEVPYWDIASKVVFCVIFIRILHSLQISLRSEKERARIDHLTGVANSRHFFELAEREINRANRYTRPVSLAYMDLDNFKSVNDTHGHKAGDELLKVVAGALKKAVRTSDIVARVGGDEFAVLFPETGFAGVERVAPRIKQSITEAMKQRGWPVTPTIGVVTCAHPKCKFDALMTAADNLMYSAKKSGKNSIKHEEIV